MTYINSDQIRDIAVKATEMFINDKVPLSAGISKQASEMELNSEQIQRAIEATNSIAFLKIQELSGDRTVEFPLAKMAEVMSDVSIPENVKTASVTGKILTNEISSRGEVYEPRGMEHGEKLVMLEKQASVNARELEQLRDRSVTILPELMKVASLIKKDSQGLEKLAALSEGSEFAMLSTLIYQEKKAHDNCGIFKEKDLGEIRKVIGLFKEAQEVNGKIKQAEELDDKVKMVKQAIFGMLGKAVGSVASAPFKAVGTLAGNSLSNAGHMAENAAANAGMIGKAAPIAKKIGLGDVAGKLVTPAFDVAAYNPGIDKTTGASKDVWTALQRQ